MSLVRKRFRLKVATILVAGLLAVLPTPSVWVEHLYSRRVYMVLQNVLTPLSGLVSFALFDLLLMSVVVSIGVRVVTALRSAERGRRLRVLLKMTLDTTALMAVLYLIFLLAWGLNYRREPLATRLDFKSSRVTRQALADLATESTARLNHLYASAHESGWLDLQDLPASLSPAFEQVQQRLGGARTATAGRPKTTLLKPYFQRAGINGMVSPFSLEILINDAILPFERPYVVTHEWAHLAGYADESEASFVGWLICLEGDDSSRYSAWLFLEPLLLQHFNEMERSEFQKRLNEGPRADLRAVANRIRDSVPIVRRNANRIYDQYLRANRVETGIASYGEVIDLILGTGS